MTKINWINEVHKRKEALIEETQAFLQIKSVYDEKTITDEAPMGKGIAQALIFLLNKAEEADFETKNLDGYAGHIQYGNGEGLIGVLCHVDVVPEGEGWSSDPYAAEIRDGKIFARGALDDKGPTIAAFYALKIIKELNLPLAKRVRLIIGTDEESKWQCVEHYFEHEEMPEMGFSPDADFPIINAEKGLMNFFLVKETEESEGLSDSSVTLLHFESGLRMNMVPEQAQAVLHIEQDQLNEQHKHIIASFEYFLREMELQGSFEYKEDNKLHLFVKGISAHGAEPYKGVHAGFKLIAFLIKLPFTGENQNFIQFVQQLFADDFYGEKLGINECDVATGRLTLNMGMLRYTRGRETRLGLNLRYPVSINVEQMMATCKQRVEDFGFRITEMEHSLPNHVDQEHLLIKTLQHVYEEQTGEEAKLLAIGGGTYARALKAGVAFGPLFPGKEDTAHQKDEHIEIEDLVKATAIYAQALYELAKDK